MYKNFKLKNKSFILFIIIIGLLFIHQNYFLNLLLDYGTRERNNKEDFNNLELNNGVDLIWQTTWGYSTRDWTPSLAFDNESNIILVGNLDHYHDIFIAKYTPDGTQLWNQT
ncbi:MAG: hypothetical protein EU548_04880, partial [Promethearchaeota archaeon]